MSEDESNGVIPRSIDLGDDEEHYVNITIGEVTKRVDPSREFDNISSLVPRGDDGKPLKGFDVTGLLVDYVSRKFDRDSDKPVSNLSAWGYHHAIVELDSKISKSFNERLTSLGISTLTRGEAKPSARDDNEVI